MLQAVFDKAIEAFVTSMIHMGLTDATVSLRGTDALVNTNLIRSWIERYGAEYGGVQLRWVINTNGSLISEEDIRFLKKHGVEAHVRIDGYKEDCEGTYHIPIPALELIRDYQLPAQINSYILPRNHLHLKDLVDIACTYGIKNLYLEQFTNFDMISQGDGIRKYREVYYYGLERGVKVCGSWSSVLRNFEERIPKKQQLMRSFSLDVNLDGSCYIPLDTVGTKNLGLHIDHLKDDLESGGWEQIIRQVIEKNERSCEGCQIKDMCYGTAIEEVHDVFGDAGDMNVNCDFFRYWIGFLTRPMFLRRTQSYQILSVIPEDRLEVFIKKLDIAIEFLSRRLWPLNEPVRIVISDYREDFLESSKQYYLPSWVNATTGSNVLFHLGSEATPHLIHELTHLYLYQKNVSLPDWFAEGVCERYQSRDYDKDLLRHAIQASPLSKAEDVLSGNTMMINIDVRRPGENHLYIQAQGFVDYLLNVKLKIDLPTLLLECRYDPLDAVLHKHTGESISQLLACFEDEIKSTL